MNFSRFPSNAPSMLYTECDSPVEPTPEDIDEFARRIGIDPETEPHLMHLARQGLMEKLPPDWKPCKDSHRDVWFYYNNKTHKSQWDHPMDGIYKEKVTQARQDHAMNRIQSFDPTGHKPLKSLPPLKKGGGGLSPIGFPPTLGNNGSKLGPLRNPSFSSSDDISQFSSSKKLKPLDASLRNPQQFNLNNNNLNGQLNGRLSSSTSNLHAEPIPRQRLNRMEAPPTAPQPIKKSGLTLTGTGASFLKSAKNSSTDLTTKAEEPKEVLSPPKPSAKENNTFHPQVPDEPSGAMTAESSASETGSGKPLKSILSKSSKNKAKPSANDSSNPFHSAINKQQNMWDINPKELNGDEYDMWNSLDLKKKGSVKFSLEDPKLKFDFSNRDDTDNENYTENTAEETEEEEDDEEDEDEEDEDEEEEDLKKPVSHKNDKSEDLSEHSASRPMSAGDSQFVTMHARTELNVENPLPKKRTDPVGQSQTVKQIDSKEVVVDRVTMKANIEKQVKEYQEQLEVERKQQESTIKSNMEKSIASFRQEMEAVISRTKDDLNDHKTKEIEKARTQMRTNLEAELDKLRVEYQQKLEKKKEELAEEYEREIKNLEAKNSEALQNVKNDPRYAQAGKEYEKQLQEEIQLQKSKLDEDHKQEIENLKAAHKVAIARLKETFKFEEEKVKKEHSNIISEMLEKFDHEKQNLILSFEGEKEKIKSEFSAKASALTTELSQNLESLKKTLEEEQKKKSKELNDLKSSKATTASLKQVEDELSDLKHKYKALEEKYTDLKQGINNVVVEEKSKLIKLDARSGLNTTMIEIPPDPHDTTDSGAAESDTSYSISMSGGGGGVERSKKDDQSSIMTNKSNDGNADRLNQALRALEELKQQIIEIKTEQKISRTPESPKFPENKGSKKVHNTTLPMTDGRAVRARSSRSAIETNNPDEKPLNVRSSSTKDISDERNYVDEAKDFIKSQKYRLKRASLSFGTPVSTSVGAKQRQDYKQLNSSAYSSESHSPVGTNYYSNKKSNNQHDHHLSETESSGVGSLKETSGGDKSRISQDIEGILSSLQQLDGQMKYLWSVVGGNSSPAVASPSPTNPMTPPSYPSRSTVSIPVNPNPLMMRPSGFSSLNLTESSLKYNLAPNLITPGNQALINSINTVNSPQFRKSFIDIPTKPMLSTLEDQIHSIKTRQNRIVQQYPLPIDFKNQDRSPSISERTKDLREWLEKF